MVDLDGDGCPRGAGVLANVGQCLLREAIESELHAGRQLASGGVDVEVDLDSGPIDVRGQGDGTVVAPLRRRLLLMINSLAARHGERGGGDAITRWDRDHVVPGFPGDIGTERLGEGQDQGSILAWLIVLSPLGE